MHILTINGNNVLWGDRSLTKISYEKVDIMMVHIVFNDCTIGFRGNETIINGTLVKDADEIIAYL